MVYAGVPWARRGLPPWLSSHQLSSQSLATGGDCGGAGGEGGGEGGEDGKGGESGGACGGCGAQTRSLASPPAWQSDTM